MSTALPQPSAHARPAPESIDPACALCGGRERRLRFVEGAHSLVTCETCDLTYVTPRLASDALLERVYDEHYWSSAVPSERGYADYLGEAPLFLATFQKRMRLVERHCPTPGRALDVGCAAGYFLRVLREHGWQVRGIEPSRVAREVAARALGVGVVRAGTLEECDLEPGSFDLVTLWDVLEHVPDPLATLRGLRALLSPGGRLIVETQDVRSLAARVLGRRWHHYKHAEHLHHFHRGTLTRALLAADLEPIYCGHSLAGKLVSPSFVVERSARLHPILPRLLAPFARILPRALYVNPHDELIAVAVPGGAR